MPYPTSVLGLDRLSNRGIVNMYGVYQHYYTSSLPTSSPSAISWIGSIQAFLLFLVGTLVGPIYDSGYVRSLLVIGSLLSVFGLFITSICKDYWQFLLSQGIVAGAGFGCLFLPGVTVVSQYFNTKKAFATGIASLGSSFGAYISPRPLDIGRRLTPFRWRYLSYCIHTASAPYRCWVGDSHHCLHCPCHPDPSTYRYAAAKLCSEATLSRRSFCLA